MEGLLQIYYGNNKGKTTAALGLCFRAMGHGLSACIVQFMKGSSYAGELFSAAKLAPQMRIAQFGRGCPYSAMIRTGQMHCRGCGQCFLGKGGVKPEDYQIARQALDYGCQVLTSGDYSIVVFDELATPLKHGLLSTQEVLEVLRLRPPQVELVLTGRTFPREIMEMGDLITEMRQVKHPFQQGVKSRRGIEY